MVVKPVNETKVGVEDSPMLLSHGCPTVYSTGNNATIAYLLLTQLALLVAWQMQPYCWL